MKKIVIEELYPEFNNLYGDRGNGRYLVKKLTAAGFDAELCGTSLYDEPLFAEGKADILLIGPCQEKHQRIEVGRLALYRQALKERIDGGGVTLATGNAFELFGEYIEDPAGERTDCLGFFPYHAKQFSRLRYNDCSVGDFEGMQITGFKNLLSHSYGELLHPFLKMKKGCGMNRDTDTEGIHLNNLFATYHTGPILPLNPGFTDYLLGLVDSRYTGVPMKYEEKAYEKRIKELL